MITSAKDMAEISLGYPSWQKAIRDALRRCCLDATLNGRYEFRLQRAELDELSRPTARLEELPKKVFNEVFLACVEAYRNAGYAVQRDGAGGWTFAWKQELECRLDQADISSPKYLRSESAYYEDVYEQLVAIMNHACFKAAANGKSVVKFDYRVWNNVLHERTPLNAMMIIHQIILRVVRAFRDAGFGVGTMVETHALLYFDSPGRPDKNRPREVRYTAGELHQIQLRYDSLYRRLEKQAVAACKKAANSSGDAPLTFCACIYSAPEETPEKTSALICSNAVRALRRNFVAAGYQVTEDKLGNLVAHWDAAEI